MATTARKRVGLLLLFILVGFFGWYVGSYYYLSRRGIREAKPLGWVGFLYVAMEDVKEEKDLDRHYSRAQLYKPLNYIDGELFGTMGPIRCILFGLSKPEP